MRIVDSKRIPVTALQIGMYVSGMDRAWSETPFPLQGFHVETKDQLETVKHLCKFVDIDIAKSRGRINPRVFELETEDPAVAASNRFLVRQEPSRELLNSRIKPMQGKPWAASQAVHVEARNARKIHAQLQTRIGGVLRDAVNAGQLSVDQLRPLAGELVDSVLRNPDAFNWISHMESRHHSIFDYCVRVATWAVLVGRHLDLKRDLLDELAVAALVCKIGYTTLPSDINEMHGSPAPHIAAARQQSLLAGIKLLQKDAGMGSRIVKAVANHLERHDGSGLPQGLEGRDIPFLAQVLGLADHYEQLISHDYNDQPLSSTEAIRQLNADRDVLFDRCLVDEFIQAIGPYPTGSLVRLNGDRVAVVIAQNPGARLRPTLMLIDGGKRLWPFGSNRVINLTRTEKDQIEASLPALPPDLCRPANGWLKRTFGAQ